MALLLDTNILVRLANIRDPKHQTAIDAVVKLRRKGEVLHFSAQNLVEFRAVATRPVTANGLGMTCSAAELLTGWFESLFELLPDTSAIHPAWKAIVQQHGIVGRQVYDARLVAICQVSGVPQILTFDTPHFVRFAPGLSVIDPASV